MGFLPGPSFIFARISLGHLGLGVYSSAFAFVSFFASASASFRLAVCISSKTEANIAVVITSNINHLSVDRLFVESKFNPVHHQTHIISTSCFGSGYAFMAAV
jgi:hypothetical protein